MRRSAALLLITTLAQACGGADAAAPSAEMEQPVRWTALTIGFGAFFDYTCGLVDDGAAYCWGDDSAGQLTGVSGADARRPVRAAEVRFTQISAGWKQTCAIATAGPAYCWGETGVDLRARPVGVVAAGTMFHRIATGNPGVCGIVASGDAYCLDPARGLEPVPGSLRFRSIENGTDVRCGITEADAAYCWGYTGYGGLGIGVQADSVVRVPTRLAGSLRFASISTALRHTCGVTVDGIAHCWGASLPRGGSGSSVPAEVPGGLRFRSVEVADDHACGLTPAGAAYCWGDNELGQLGVDASIKGSAVPVPVSGGLVFTSLAAGGSHSCATTADGAAYCWGLNSNGQLGDGSPASQAPMSDIRWAPVRVANPLR
jgi:alpha-tubulin suppressor-like RCC1 family protein